MRGMQTTAREPAWKGAALVTGGFVVLLWLLEIVDAATGNPLDAYGVQPRSEDGLVGVALAPTLHFGFLNRRTVEIFIGVAVFLLYSSALLGVLPGQPGVSWQGHLFGAVGGFLAARVLTTRQRSESSITY